MRAAALLVAAVLLAPAAALLLPASTAAEVVFYGQPVKKITTTYESSDSQLLIPSKAREYAVTITSEGGQFLWASRENKPLARTEGVTYITYHATDGSGYVRVYQPFMYEMLGQLPPDQRAKEIGYVEHLVHQFGSITYYGDKR